MKPDGATSPSVLRVIGRVVGRQAPAPAMLAAFRKEARQQRRCLLGQHAGADARVVVQARLGEEVDDAAACAGLRIGGADRRGA